MQGDVLLLVLFLVLGCAACIFGVLYLICRLFARVGRGVAGVFKPCGPAGMPKRLMKGPRRRVCPNVQCRKNEYRREAVYCSQCGVRFPGT